MAKRGIEPVDMTGVMLKIILIAMFFSVDISYVVAELKRRKELRCFAQVGEIHEAQKIYRFLSRFSEEQFYFLSGSGHLTPPIKIGWFHGPKFL